MSRYLRITNIAIYVVIALFSLNGCSGGGGIPDLSCMFGCPSAPPTANAGPDQNVPTSSFVYLDGSGSSDPDGDKLSYNWTVISYPGVTPPTIENWWSSWAHFVPMHDGVYVISLTVSDGASGSPPDTAIITASQYAPVASAGPDVDVPVNTTVTLDGSSSYDPNRSPITYLWTVVSIPSGSTITLSDNTASQPTFFADVAGTYEFSLIVNDGQFDSNTDKVVLTAVNFLPVADGGGPYPNMHVGTTVNLDGSGSSDPNGDTLTFSWSFQQVPPGSGATLSDSTATQPTFTTDLIGTYTLNLVVNDGLADSSPDTVSIVAVNTQPVSNAGQDQQVDIGSQVYLDGSGSNDIDGDSLTFQWSFVGLPAGSSAVFYDPTSLNPYFTVDLEGTYSIILTVVDDHGGIATDTLVVTSPIPTTFGGNSNDSGMSVKQTTDGGYIITGTTYFLSNQVFLIKTDAVGNLLWEKNFGGSRNDSGQSVQQTLDDGYIITGIRANALNWDAYLVKTDDAGNLLWQKTFGGTGNDRGNSVQQTADGGYIVTGLTSTLAGDYFADSDMYLFKTDGAGNLLWEKTFSGDRSVSGSSVQQTSDGGYVITGSKDVYSVIGIGYYSDVYLIKTDGSGNLQWEKTFGGGYDDHGASVQQTVDGGFIITGNLSSGYGWDSRDLYLVKTDSSGILMWEKTFGGSLFDSGASVQQTTDNGYVICGRTYSIGAGGSDVYLIKTDSSGDLVSERPFGGISGDLGWSVQQTMDGNFIIVGGTSSYGAGANDVYMIKTDGISTLW